MLKRKKFVGIVVMILVILGIYGNTLAADKQTSTSEVNNITANWEYEINASNLPINQQIPFHQVP